MANKGKGKREATAVKLERAKQKLGAMTDTLMKRYEFEGLIDQQTQKFAHEYGQGVDGIVRPFLLAKDADALAELSVARLAQLRRIYIDDEGEFFDREIADVYAQLGKAFDYGGEEQRTRLFALLVRYMKEHLDGRRSWLCSRERNVIEDVIGDTFAREACFAADVIELADERLGKASADEDVEGTATVAFEGDPDGGHGVDLRPDVSESARARWSLTRMIAMAARGDSGDALHAYAEENELLAYTEALNLLADTYETEGQPRKAIATIRENAGAIDMCPTDERECYPMELVNRMLDLAWGYFSKTQLIDLYYEILLNESYTMNALWYERSDWHDVAHWYDEMHGLVGEPAWADTREKLLSSAPSARKRVFLGHDQYIGEFNKRMMACLDDELAVHERHEASPSEMDPTHLAKLYCRYAELLMRKANKWEDYHEMATALSCAARRCGKWNLAQESASTIASAHSRKRSLLQELRQEGFNV